MPYSIIKSSGAKPWKIKRKDDGKIVGSSKTKTNAEASVKARLAGEHGYKFCIKET